MLSFQKILMLLTLTAICLAPVQAKVNTRCHVDIDRHIIHLEVLTDAYNQGEIEADLYLDLVERVDQQVVRELNQCRSRQQKMRGFFAQTFGEDSRFFEFIENLSLNYKQVREELLNGTERVD
jgi:hypothetical protein